MVDERLERDLAKAKGPTDNAGVPVVAHQQDPLTFVAGPPPTAEDVVGDKLDAADMLVEQWKELPEVRNVAGRVGLDDPVEAMLMAIARQVVGLQPWEGPDDEDADEVDAAAGISSWRDQLPVGDVLRGDTVVTNEP